jgi:hypothetical protein
VRHRATTREHARVSPSVIARTGCASGLASGQHLKNDSLLALNEWVDGDGSGPPADFDPLG